jgi:hypothetical protein
VRARAREQPSACQGGMLCARECQERSAASLERQFVYRVPWAPRASRASGGGCGFADECSHSTANLLTALRMPTRMLPRMLPRMLRRMLLRMLRRMPTRMITQMLLRVLPEHLPMPTELRHSSYPLKVRQPLLCPLCIDTPSSKDRKIPVPQMISKVGILDAAVRSVAGY